MAGRRNGVEVNPLATETRSVNIGDRTLQVATSPELEAESKFFAGQAGLNIDGQGNIRVGDPGHAPGKPRDPVYESRMASLKQRVQATGIQPATVVNFLPFVINVNAPATVYRGGVPAAEGAARYATRTWEGWEGLDIHVIEQGEVGRTPQEFYPIQTAKVFEREYGGGGVVALPFALDVIEDPDEARIKRRELKGQSIAEILDDHAEKAVKFMSALVDRAEAMAADDNVAGIRKTHRMCAVRLHALGILAHLPSYCVARQQLRDVAQPCPDCGQIPKGKNAVRCLTPNCGFILDPAEAYRRGVIDENDAALERLTRTEVEDLGVTEYVAETADEKPKRIKRGDPKPPSNAALKALAMAEPANATA